MKARKGAVAPDQRAKSDNEAAMNRAERRRALFEALRDRGGKAFASEVAADARIPMSEAGPLFDALVDDDVIERTSAGLQLKGGAP